ncbi:hypothetical protein [Actinobacillus pleuropneumoniae]|uniref:hypothetical protein n=1 Tax=Actinobacillus pleuropneumoniae TaxID=715 RepID=UPI002279FC14|nr:hypothetical protein [Actinobacillus pleuropneumoniae]MCY6488326.1 hypothetical protein [Actinobacillus pleuropneumoniae]
MIAISQAMCKLEVDQEMSIVKSHEEDNCLEPFSEEEHLREQFQFDMDYEDDEDFSYKNSIINGWISATRTL